jgi:hypothetical protein
MQSVRIHLAAALITASLLPAGTRALESEMPELTSYMGIRFQNTPLQALMKQFGKSVLFDPPGEVLQPYEVCYQTEKFNATFFVEHYGRSRSASTVVGVTVSLRANNANAGPLAKSATCAVPKVTLSDCIGRLCLGDSFEHVKQITRKEMTYSDSYEWTYDVHLSPGDPVVSAYRDGAPEFDVPDWMYPSHIVRVQVTSGFVTGIYVLMNVDIA